MVYDIALFGATFVLSYFWLRRRKLLLKSNDSLLTQQLQNGTSLNASERICTVTADNNEIKGGHLRAQMRLDNLWHRATYILIKHQVLLQEQYEDVYVLVQRRSKLKDYCPGKLDPTPGGVVGYGESYQDNAIRELQEEMGIDCIGISSNNSDSSSLPFRSLFTFPYQDERVRVWGEFFECVYHGSLKDLKLQEEEVDEVLRMSLQELSDLLESSPDDFMPDACHAMRLYFQLQSDLKLGRRLLKGYSSGDLEKYGLRPKPRAIFFDCDDTLYFDNWTTASKLTKKIDEWCVAHGLESGKAYQLYKQYGTALRGLLAEGYMEDSPEAIDGFLKEVHDIGIPHLLQRDERLRAILLQMDPSIPKYIFTASVAHHAQACLKALGIDDGIFEKTIIDCKLCNFESKHAEHSFRVAMQVAGVTDDPERCLFLDDNLVNLKAARHVGWRCALVGKVGRDCKQTVSSEHAEIEMESIHELPSALPELFGESTPGPLLNVQC